MISVSQHLGRILDVVQPLSPLALGLMAAAELSVEGIDVDHRGRLRARRL